MTTQAQINQFFDQQTIAVAGVSRNPKKFGYTAFKEVRDKGMEVIPINPNVDEIDGKACYRSVKDLPDTVNALWIMTPKEKTGEVVSQALNKGIKHIWIQQMSDTPEVLEQFKDKEINLIARECMLMHYKPHGFHKFHRFLKGLFGRLPK